MVSERLPLFPLSAVLFPGAVLPLHIFEDRYRKLMHDLLDAPGAGPHVFGVVAIELGHEVGVGAARSLAKVGCTALVREVTRHPDGRFDLIVVGTTRFLIDTVDDDLPYLRASVTPLPDEIGRGAEAAGEAVTSLLHRYLDRLDNLGARPVIDTPTDPLPLSYAVAAAMRLPRPVKQRLLEAEHAAARLELERALLRREAALLAALPSLPAAELFDREIEPN